MGHKKQVLSILASLLSGSLVATMVRLNASLGEKIGIVESAFVVHLVGTFFLLSFLFSPAHRGFLKNLKETPKHLWIGGVLGVLVVLTSNYCVPQLGLLLTLGLFVCANLFFSTCADHFGFFDLPRFPMTQKRLLGLIIAITGVALVYGST